MNALRKRIRPGRGAAPEPVVDVAPTVAEDPVAPAEPAAPAPEARPAVPAGIAPEELIGERPDTRRRSRMRRRLRHLRRVRELMLRDIGGLVYEVHRAGEAAGDTQHTALVRAKLERLAGLDAERRELEVTLDDLRREVVLREPGVGGSCPSCGEYFASEARFCSHCGVRVDGVVPAEMPTPVDPADPVQPAPVRPAPVEPAP
jgi:hypothetical protein